MSTRLRGEAGMTLIELVLAMSLMLIVFAATLAVFTVMERGTAQNQRLNDSQAQARIATDALAKRLRNLASPSDSNNPLDQQPLERAESQDLVFRTVRADSAPTAANPQNLERYRYCLATDKRLVEQRQTWTGTVPPTPPDTACPGSGWTSTRTAAANVVNGARPLFYYQGSPVPGTYSELTSVAPADFPTAIALRSTIYVDPDVARSPAATTLSTRVFLRNQNRPPLAAFTVSASGRKITLNGSQSDDPEGNPVTYQWYDNGVALTDPITGVTIPPAASAIHSFSVTSAGSHSLTLKVFDVGNLSATASPAKTVSCTGTTSVSCTPS